MSDNLALKEGCYFVKKKKARERERAGGSKVKGSQSTFFSCQQSEDCAALSGSLSKAALSTRANEGPSAGGSALSLLPGCWGASTLLRHQHFQARPEPNTKYDHNQLSVMCHPHTLGFRSVLGLFFFFFRD